MIIGTLALLTLLFGSGSFELFFVHDFEKGVKEIVIDKDRKKDILSDIKEIKSVVKEYDKLRNSEFEEFKELNTSRTITADEFTEFFTEIRGQRIANQSAIIDFRVVITEKIKPSEWDSILAFSNRSVEEEIAADKKNVEKKKNKSPKKPFEDTRQTLTDVMSDSDKEKNIINGLEELVSSMDVLQKEINRAFEIHQDVIAQKGATNSDFKKLTQNINKVRKEFYDGLTSFHFTLNQNTNDEEWKAIIKMFNKELSLMNK